MIKPALLCLTAVVLSMSCATTQVLVPAEQRTSIKSRLEGEERYLKQSMYVTPLFGDATKHMLTAVPPEQVRLLENPDSTSVNPGVVQAIFPAGTTVRIKNVEFPTPLVQAERVLMTPRMLAWVYLDVAGTPKDAAPYVLVLRPQIKNETEFLAEVERSLSSVSLEPQLSAMSPVVRDAIAKKEALPDMTADALEMAWGSPERRVLAFEGSQKKETWLWADGLRQATLLDGKVTELK